MCTHLQHGVIVKSVFQICDDLCNVLHWDVNDYSTSKSVKEHTNKMAEMDIQLYIYPSIKLFWMAVTNIYIYTEKQWEPLRMQRIICITFSENRDSFFFSEVPAEKQRQLCVSPNNHTHTHILPSFQVRYQWSFIQISIILINIWYVNILCNKHSTRCNYETWVNIMYS